MVCTQPFCVLLFLMTSQDLKLPLTPDDRVSWGGLSGKHSEGDNRYVMRSEVILQAEECHWITLTDSPLLQTVTAR